MAALCLSVPANAAAQRYTFNGESGGTPAALSHADNGDVAFSAKAAPGDYQVTLTLRSESPLRALVWAEDRQVVGPPVDLAAGATVTQQFTINVRDPALVKVWTDLDPAPKVAINADEARGRSW